MPRILKNICIFLIVFAIGTTNCFSQGDSSAYKMKKVYFGVEVCPVVSFKGKFSGDEKFGTVIESGVASYSTSYNSKNNKPLAGGNAALKVNFRIYKGLRLNTGIKYSFLGYQTGLVDTATRISHNYLSPTSYKSQRINSFKYKYLFEFASVPILLGYEIECRKKVFYHAYFGVEPTFLVRYVIDEKNVLNSEYNHREEYEFLNAFQQVGDRWIGEKFDDNYFLFYHGRIGLNYFVSKKRFLSFDASYSISSPRTGLKSQLHNIGIVIGYNF